MKILVVGSGGREHAIAWKILNDNPNFELYCIGTNAGISEIAKCVELKTIEEIADFAQQSKIDFTVVGPEAFLAQGIVDEFSKRGLKIFGPNKKAAQLESSKVFAKQFMLKYGIPTADFAVFDDPNEATRFVEKKDEPLVIKADGLAAGKGTFVAKTKQEALNAIDLLMRKKIFKEAGAKIVVEKFLEGKEVSALAFCDGQTVVPMPGCMDYKRAYDNDQGPNTGGMGCVSPVSHYDKQMQHMTYKLVFERTLEGLQKEGIDYRGVIYAGLMITKQGPFVLEYNCRFGDPETQVLMLLLKSNLLEILQATVERQLSRMKVDWFGKAGICVVLASGGYPENYEIGYEIKGLEECKAIVFHAGTKKVNGKCVTNGGRVLNVCAVGETVAHAREIVYREIKKIHFEKMHYRTDIGLNV
ncbi:phosphoribosylamine--glycine ligase [Pseudothermotoga thermarum]|uniref:Phosphoribosylamine--glycine ligase n=1 Tax=Pseudothermotoga thermarum DSM 5069 TaxID=688269 RepID=F7YWW4_9THEM|nr:phosphoribosylamine--glycine ligase [Pseudothermotoga thermarum]AEH50556.1 phosphoribosylamine--glycine ligase [Pseudothermotoga thermarum DSM 5069]